MSDWFKCIDSFEDIDLRDIYIDFHAELVRKAICDQCYKEYTFHSQKDDSPEYYTYITTECICGRKILMKFPVG